MSRIPSHKDLKARQRAEREKADPDARERIKQLIWETFSGSIRVLLDKLVPVINEIMLDHPKHDWGPSIYPTVTAPARPVGTPRVPSARS